MERPVFDYSKLRGRIIEKFGSYGAFYNAIGWTRATASNRMTSKAFFTQPEIVMACKMLEIQPENVTEYFFNQKL